MNKDELLQLEANAHLSVAELRVKQPKLDERLEKRAQRQMVARLPGASDKLQKLLGNIKIPIDKQPEKLKLREATLEALRDAAKKDKELSGDAELAKELDELEKTASVPTKPGTKADSTLAEYLRLNDPIAFHPEFKNELDAAKLYKLSDATGLGDKTADLLIKEVGRPGDISEARLQALVKDKKLKAEEAEAVGFAASLYNILDERTELVGAVKAGVGNVRELVKLDKQAWTKLIQDSKVKTPGRIAADAYAELLEGKVKRLFPTDALSERLSKVSPKDAVKRNSELDALRKLNPNVKLAAKKDFSALNTEGLSPAELKKVEAAFRETAAVVNRFSGMRVVDVLEDSSLSEAQRESEIDRRVGMATKFFVENQDVLGVDLTPGSAETKALKFVAGATDQDKAMVLATARTYQRALTVTEDITDAESLVGGGYPSAISLAMSRPRKIAVRTGLKEEKAARYYDKAKRIATGVTAHAGTVMDVVGGMFNDTAVGNISTEVAGYLKEIPGFADFFGNQNFCNCKHCQSILGPAAYFVDLMCFVDENVTQEFFADKPDHPLDLRSRRPDLWTLELTCESTNTSIPYLVIINEILENAVAKDARFAGDFGDRVAVATTVYRDTLPDRVDSFRQPLNLPFEELRTFLKHFERTLADVAEAGNATKDALARLRLSLPPKDFELITSQTNSGLPFLERVYGIDFTEAVSAIQKFDAQLLLKPMAVSRHELGELIATRFVTAKGTISIRIVGEKKTPDSIQNDIENISGLTRVALDRMHRFVRLWRATGWRIGELDLVLTHVEQARLGGSSMDASAVRAVAAIHRMQTRRELTAEEAVALWSLVPRQPVLRSLPPPPGGADYAPSVYPAPVSPLARLTVPLFDRLFNQKSFVDAVGTYPKPAINFLHPALAGAAPGATAPNLHRLLAGLRATEDELLQLILGLARPLGVDPDSNVDAEKAFALDERNLSLLYRHARLAKLLRRSVPELFALAAMADHIPNNHIEGLADVEALLELSAWVATTDWTLGELLRIRRPGHPATITSQAAVAASVGGETVTYTATLNGAAQPSESVTLGANADLDAVIADWNAQAQHTVAYRSDAFAVETQVGDRLSIRTRGTGLDASLEVTADSLPLFAPALPTVSVGRSLASALPQPELPDSEVLAKAIVAQVAEANSLLFADTVFALLPPTAPVATSTAAVASTAGGESVTYTAVLAGEAKGEETITLAANPDLDSVVADWNGKAVLSRAYRSDATGEPLDSGTHLSITVDAASGSSTKIVVLASAAPLFRVGEYTGAAITEEQSRDVFDRNAPLFEVADAQGRYRLKRGFDPAAPLNLPGTVDASLAPALLEVLAGFHSTRLLPALLASRINIDPSSLPPLVAMLGVDVGQDSFYRELRGDVPPVDIGTLIDDLRPLALLFKDRAVFESDTLGFVAQEGALFELADFRALSTNAIRNVETFRSLRVPWTNREQASPDLPDVLRSFAPGAAFGSADQADIAALLGCDEGLLQSLTANIPLASTPLAALRELRIAADLATRIGIGGSAITLAHSAAYDDLSAASAAVQAAFRTKYPDEAEWEKKVEPFENALLSRRRDGLVAYLVHSSAPQFDEVSDLYHYYLLDVELEGCARTSRVASAIDTVQLYLHRCLMNLEETPPGDANAVHVLPERIPADEWEWRQNYRIWEANRKIFLYPENYIEPELRDNKTPLFKQLEEELLSKEITDEAILEAYARYLRGFDELAHLTIAGSYHEKDEEAKRDVLHLCGVTSNDPPIYYYRRVENAHYGATSDEIATHWGAWEKMNIQVPSRKLSPIVHRGQLYVFWNRYTTKPTNEIIGGTSTFTGYEHRAILEFSKRHVDGSWTVPQKVLLESAPFTPIAHPSWYGTGGTIKDTIELKHSTLGFVVVFRILGQYAGSFYADPRGRLTGGPIPGLQLPPEIVIAGTTTTTSQDGYELVVTPIPVVIPAPLYDYEEHPEPKDGYSLTGFGWDRPYPSSDGGSLSVRAFNFQMNSTIDPYRLSIGDQLWLDTERVQVANAGVPWFNPGALTVSGALVYLCTCGKVNLLEDLIFGPLIWSRASFDKRLLHKTSGGIACFDRYSFASVLADKANIEHFKRQMATSEPWDRPQQWDKSVTDYLDAQLSENLVGEVPADTAVEIVNGSVSDVILQTTSDVAYLQYGVRADGRYHLRRLNTSLSEDVGEILFGRGLSELLATSTQLGLAERPTPFDLNAAQTHDATNSGEVDFNGAMGVYLREIFFHIPFLIADHLNSQGRFEDSEHWYRYIFDPTAAETVQGIDPGLPDNERRARALDRNWRYREFRNLTPETLRAQLTNTQALEAYRREPFNPHAVARLRLSAYQKAVLMKYVDNLIDWGDDLFIKAFSLRNPEYLRLASLKYVTAQDILGDRPALLGDCGDGKLNPKSFKNVKEHLDEDSEFLMEMESTVAVAYRKGAPKKGIPKAFLESGNAESELRLYSTVSSSPMIKAAPARTAATSRAVRSAITKYGLDSEEYRKDAARFSRADLAVMKPAGKKKDLSAGVFDKDLEKRRRAAAGGFSVSIVTQIRPIFCVPGNDRMLAHWDRVADRLYKLRHCMDIEGVPRQLPLFAPSIDPGLLVGARAAGLSLDDIIGAAGGALSPYRFRYLIDKAKGYAGTVQAFGAALLGALEKRDAEELARLRNTHQKNILALTTEVKRNELKVAEEGVEATRRRQNAAQYRYDYYAGLISAGLTAAEITQTGARFTAMGFQAGMLGLRTGAAIAGILPSVGSPFAMTYGGEEVNRSLNSWAQAGDIPGKLAELIAAIAGIVAGFERREQGWEHQKKLADNDLKTIEKEMAIGELRKAIASRGLDLHEKAKDQHDEVIDFFDDKFSNLGLYTYLSRALQQLHREAYSNALAIARLAEQAYRFERPGDNTFFVGGEWDASRSGLLAGERLNIALQSMERRFIETSARSSEINQSFSLAQINPQALIDLKEIGSCEFDLPEFFFDMFYPGQYRRRIRAVRLTIPCITGPYTNVSAKLTLLSSRIRRDATLGVSNLLEVPLGGTTTVATSTAQGDAGVFELSFRDERYMPFEGAGAVSSWSLTLPSQFRPFDYQSINDVILNVSYTAEEDGLLRQDVEARNAAVAGSLEHFLSNNTLTRVFSLRQEFSSVFNRLMQAAVGTPVTFEFNERHFPLFLQGRVLNAAAAHLVLGVQDRKTTVGTFALSLNGTIASAFPAPTNPASAGDLFGGLPSRPASAAFAAGLKRQHSIAVENAGALALDDGGGAVDPDKLKDIMLVVEYGL
jgi:hypothetical protein